MQHTCEHCSTRYEIEDEKVQGRFVKVRCKQCHGVMHVSGVSGFSMDTPAGPAVWWAGLRGAAHGPFTAEDVLTLVDLGDIHARTRLWCDGMAGWQRVCEAASLSWVYARLVERAAGDEALLAGEPSRLYDTTALLSDGHGYFPDPTLKSGIILLDDATQRSLERLARKNGIAVPDRDGALQREPTVTLSLPLEAFADAPAPARPSVFAPVMAAAAGAAAAAGGFVWLVAETLL